jgi:hypothetical protein
MGGTVPKSWRREVEKNIGKEVYGLFHRSVLDAVLCRVGRLDIELYHRGNNEGRNNMYVNERQWMYSMQESVRE